jgi:uncharacterized protein YciI
MNAGATEDRTMTARTAFLLLGVLLGGGALPAGEPPPSGDEMTTYQFVLLLRGPNQEPWGERQIQRHQEEHLAYLGGLLEEGKALLFGPVDGDEALRGVVVLDVPSTAEAEALMRQDPWVRAGRLVPEVHPWWTARGIVRKPPNILHLSTVQLGLLRRPAGAPEFPEERLREIQAGHLANIRRMAESGDLVLAGPMADDGPLRGIFVFRTRDQERIRAMVAADPAVKMGRLGMELYPWSVPAGSIPEP